MQSTVLTTEKGSLICSSGEVSRSSLDGADMQQLQIPKYSVSKCICNAYVYMLKYAHRCTHTHLSARVHTHTHISEILDVFLVPFFIFMLLFIQGFGALCRHYLIMSQHGVGKGYYWAWVFVPWSSGNSSGVSDKILSSSSRQVKA